MSDFDSNPFADPEDDNPFADSSVQRASGANTAAAGLDGYNPFAEKPTPTAAPAAAPSVAPPNVNQSAVIQPTPQAPPPYQPSAAQQVDTAELQRRQEELERKAAELQEREDRLRERAVAGEKPNNFPPLPACCPVKPCFFQDFNLEIPPEFVRVTKIAFYTWIARSVLYIFNFLFALGYMVSGAEGAEVGSTFGLSILWVILYIPASFICWYRPVYKAFRSDSSINFFLYFAVSGAQVIADGVFILGIQGSGYLGFLTALSAVKNADQTVKNVGYTMFVVVSCAIAITVVDVVLLVRIHRQYRGTGASFQKAQSEFTTGVLKNETVRTAGSQFAAEAATGALNNAANSANKY